MSIFIKEIIAKNIGPIDKTFSMDLGILNLIYGYNETGKTYLVEFLIRCLFRKNDKYWRLREKVGSGKVVVSGLNDDDIEFRMASRKPKIEDFLCTKEVGLPTDISKLLVVKGAELELKRNIEAGIDKEIIKNYLSSKAILDSIYDPITKAIRSTLIENQEIILGGKAGLTNKYEELKEKLSVTDVLFRENDKLYSGGNRRILSDKLTAVRQEIERLTHAKRYEAYRISQKIYGLEKERNRTSADQLHDLSQKLSAYKTNKVYHRDIEKKLAAANEGSKHYNWLKCANQLYQNLMSERVSEPHWIFPYLTLLLVALTVLSLFLRPLWPKLLLFAVTVFVGLVYFIKYRQSVQKVGVNEELQKLEREFENRFKYKLSGLPDLEKEIEEQGKVYHQSVGLCQQYEESAVSLKTQQQQISDSFVQVVGQEIDEDAWTEKVRVLRSKQQELSRKIEVLKEKYVYRTVEDADYLDSSPGIKYDRKRHEKLFEDETKISKQLEEELEQLQRLKQRICDQTHDEISIDWETLIGNLQQRREHLLHEYKDTAAQIIGQVAVCRVIEELVAIEDVQIQQELTSTVVQAPLYEVTKKYKTVRLEDEQLIVSGDTDEFFLSKLSTGAQEQVLLALRIGLARKLMKKSNLFLILDDAFQYSDHERRINLMDVVVNLAKNGWQIVYFTMDNNIRDLFDGVGKSFGDDYKRKDLG